MEVLARVLDPSMNDCYTMILKQTPVLKIIFANTLIFSSYILPYSMLCLL